MLCMLGMSLPHLTIDSFCTEQVATIDANDSVHNAQELMVRHGIRHLPVTEQNKCVGVLSDRDIHAALAVKGAHAKTMDARDICSPHAYVTHPGSPLEAVAKEMAEKKFGSAVVTDDKGKVLGIFTSTDAMRTLARVLSGEMGDT